MGLASVVNSDHPLVFTTFSDDTLLFDMVIATVLSCDAAELHRNIRSDLFDSVSLLELLLQSIKLSDVLDTSPFFVDLLRDLLSPRSRSDSGLSSAGSINSESILFVFATLRSSVLKIRTDDLSTVVKGVVSFINRSHLSVLFLLALLVLVGVVGVGGVVVLDIGIGLVVIGSI